MGTVGLLPDLMGKNFDKIQALSAEKLALARKVYAYVEANVGKIGQKMR